MMKRKLSGFFVLKMILTAIAVLYIPAINLIPFLEPLRKDFLGWLIYIGCVLSAIFLWGISVSRNRFSGKKDEPLDETEIEITKTVVKEKYRWFW